MQRAGLDHLRQDLRAVSGDGGDSLKEGKPLTDASYLYRGRSAVPGVGVAAMNFQLG